MNTLLYTIAIVSILPLSLLSQERKTYRVNTVAFYNLENLFDFRDDPFTYDDDRTPEGRDRWTEALYQAKLANMASVISEIGTALSGTSPAVIGVCEIEHRGVLEDLLNQPALVGSNYGIIHYDSPDRRGIDVALLYLKGVFYPIHHSRHPLYIYDHKKPGKRLYTRDQLLVSGLLDGDPIHIIVNHWPSRSGGEARSRYKRIAAAKLNRRIIDSILSENPYAKIITMGDLNDDPSSPSIKKILGAKRNRGNVRIKQLYNPMEQLYKEGYGTLAWRDGWNLFDQLIISQELLKQDYSSYRFYKAGIYNKSYLLTPNGRYKGYPFRSFTDGQFTGGYSDHFPVYLYLIRELERAPKF